MKSFLHSTHAELFEQLVVGGNGLSVEAAFLLATYSHSKVLWRCPTCCFEWKARVYNRIRGSACPVCAGSVSSENKNLAVLFPLLASEFCGQRNGVSPSSILPSSHKRYWWVCNKCSYVWRASVCRRTSGSGCPVCSRNTASTDTSLLTCFPRVAAGWSPNNAFGPETVLPGSGRRVWWVCTKCGGEWLSEVRVRVRGSGCPRCASSPVSKKACSWLDGLGISNSCRETLIVVAGRRLRVDAYVPETNTIFEFLGDYWHGNPTKHFSEGINAHNRKTFGQLFDETVERLRFFRAAGYNLNIIWESDYTKQNGTKV